MERLGFGSFRMKTRLKLIILKENSETEANWEACENKYILVNRERLYPAV